ncbi:MAG: CheR family methyltransferase [Myxococcota bacterium]
MTNTPSSKDRRDWDALLQWALPRLHLRWRGFKRVRKQVIKRLQRRTVALGLDHPDTYRRYVTEHPEEWAFLDRSCRITISRFRRDRGVFDLLGDEVLPRWRRANEPVRMWSAGCASGEEPYSLVLCWQLDVAAQGVSPPVEVLATDADEQLIERARRACYALGTLKEVPLHWLDAFEETDAGWVLRTAYRRAVRFERADVRQGMPRRRFELIACRNLAFTYFDTEVQRSVFDGLVRR